MNYYNPYFVSMQPAVFTQKAGLFSRLFNGINLGKILNGTQKVLNFANQTIPLVQQVRPMIGNAKTMFKVMNEFKKNEKNNTVISNNDTKKNITATNKIKSNYKKENNYKSEDNLNNENIGPTFFV